MHVTAGHPIGSTFGQTVTYNCDEGYILLGDNTRVCQATGVWSGSVPTCECKFLQPSATSLFNVVAGYLSVNGS